MMGDEERILLEQDQEYHFSEEVVPKQAYQQPASEAKNEESAAAPVDGKLQFKLFKTPGGLNELIALLRSGWKKLYGQVLTQIKSIKSPRDLWAFKTVRVILLLLSILILYLMMRWWDGYKGYSLATKAVDEQTVGANSAADARLEARIGPFRFGGDTEEGSVSSAKISAEVDKRVAALEKAVESSISAIEDLGRESARSQNQLNELSQHTLDMVSMWKQAIRADQETRQMRQQVGYVIYGINAKRAWLKSHRGELVSVRVGSTLPGYGRVLKIDPAHGKVVTEGAVISWGNDDY